jgi:hypothetical protein
MVCNIESKRGVGQSRIVEGCVTVQMDVEATIPAQKALIYRLMKDVDAEDGLRFNRLWHDYEVLDKEQVVFRIV